MRLLLTLKAEADQKDISLDYHKVQGFIYRMFQEGGFHGIHDKEGYKYFCFSNVFPYGDMKAGDSRNFIISSPSTHLIDALEKQIYARMGSRIHIGDCSFSILDSRRIDVSLPFPPVKIVCATPIILRIPERNYDLYGVPENERKPRYIYWRPSVSFEAFVKQLSENLVKKYNEYYGTEVANNNLFERFIFKKTVHTRIIIDGRSYGVAASLWEFSWNHMDLLQKKIVRFGMDTGFGERNTFGFGFVNLIYSGKTSRPTTP